MAEDQDNFDWPKSAVIKLRKLWGTGLTASEIANRIGAPGKNAVLGKARRMGLPPLTDRAPRPHNPSRQTINWSEAALTILRDGYSLAGARQIPEIAAAIGCSRNSVLAKAKELGLKHPFRNGVYPRPGNSATARPGRGTQIKLAGTPKTPAPPASDKAWRERFLKREGAMAPDSRNLPLGDLGIGACRFATTPNGVKPWEHRFCGAKIAIEVAPEGPDRMQLPYCAHHIELARAKPESEAA